MDEEELARALHKATRDAIETGKVLVHLKGGFIDFDDLPENVRQGRIMTAKSFLKGHTAEKKLSNIRI